MLTGSLPWTGTTFVVDIAPVPQPAAAVLALGFSATTLFGAIPLPLDLTLLGMTGCSWYTDIAVNLPHGRSRRQRPLVSTNAGAAIVGAK